MSSTFIRFLDLKETLSSSAVDAEIDLTAQKLLEVICVRHHQEQRLTVTEAMRLQHVASPATLHRKLSTLLAHGYIAFAFAFEGANRRTKYIEPTEKTNRHLVAMGAALKQALTTAG